MEALSQRNMTVIVLPLDIGKIKKKIAFLWTVRFFVYYISNKNIEQKLNFCPEIINCKLEKKVVFHCKSQLYWMIQRSNLSCSYEVDVHYVKFLLYWQAWNYTSSPVSLRNKRNKKKKETLFSDWLVFFYLLAHTRLKFLSIRALQIEKK